jgi:hypothetical protein
VIRFESNWTPGPGALTVRRLGSPATGPFIRGKFAALIYLSCCAIDLHVELKRPPHARVICRLISQSIEHAVSAPSENRRFSCRPSGCAARSPGSERDFSGALTACPSFFFRRSERNGRRRTASCECSKGSRGLTELTLSAHSKF